MRRLLAFLCFLFLVSCGNSPALVWKFTTGGRIYASPVVSNEQLITGSADSFLYDLDLKTGQVVWKKHFGAPFFSGPYLLNSTLYSGTGKGDFVAMNPVNGKILWTVPTGSVIEYVPCADDQGLYFGNNSGFYHVDFDGKVLWQKSFNKFFHKLEWDLF